LEFNEKQVISRLIELRTAFAGARGKNRFANALGISASTYNYYENDRLAPVGILLKICEITGVDLHWLLTGHAGGGLQGSNDPLARKVEQAVAKYPAIRAGVNAFIDLYTQNLEAKLVQEGLGLQGQADVQRSGWIPILGRTAAGIVHFWDKVNLPKGDVAITELEELVEKYAFKDIVSSQSGQVSLDVQSRGYISDIANRKASIIHLSDGPGPVEFIDCGEIKRRFADSFALHVDGDSMSPRLKDGDCVVLSPSIGAVEGQMAVVKLSDQVGVSCKIIRFEGEDVHLISLNEKYVTRVAAKKDLLWSLAVLCYISL